MKKSLVKKFILLGLVFVFLTTSGFGCKGVSQDVAAKMQPITLTVWGVWESQDDLRPIIENYQRVHPNITVNYRKLSSAEYTGEILNALAEDRGPDIFAVNVNELRNYLGKIAPLPSEITMAYPVEKGTVKKEIVPELKTTKSISLNGIKNNFIDTVYDDVVINYDNPKTKTKELRVFGLPLSMDTMVMYFNRDLLNNANIGQLSAYWDKQFQKDIKKLTKQDAQGNIIQAGVAMGGGANIERSADLLTLIMSQSGADIIAGNDRAAFTQYVSGKDYNPGIDAIRFYCDFSNPTKDVYAWNDKLDNSLKMFMDGRLAVMFGYAYHLPIIKAQAPKLNFGITAMPQLGPNNSVKNSADYWVETVSKKSKHITESWDFVQFASLNTQAVSAYLEKTKRPTALRALIENQKADNDLSVFANQLLTSSTWYRGYGYTQAVKAFEEMVAAISQNPKELDHEARVAEDKVSQTLDAPRTD